MANFSQQIRPKRSLLVLARITQRVGHHVAAVVGVVAGGVQVAVQPGVGLGEQVVQRIAKAGRAGGAAVARVGAVQAGGKVGDDHGGAIKRCGQCAAQPVLALQALRTHLLGQEGFAVAGDKGFFQVVVGGAKGFFACFELLCKKMGR